MNIKLIGLLTFFLLSLESPAKSLLDDFCNLILAGPKQEWSIQSGTVVKKVVGRARRWTGFKMDSAPGSTMGYSGQYSLTEIIPDDGAGHYILIETALRYRREYPILWTVALERPEQMAQFDVYADKDRLLIGNGKRTTAILKHYDIMSPEIIDIPRLKKQWYEEDYFNRQYRNGKIAFASRDISNSTLMDGFTHDRLGEHFLAALAIPPSLFADTVYASMVDPKINPYEFWDPNSTRLGNAVVQTMIVETLTVADITLIISALQNWARFTLRSEHWSDIKVLEPLAFRIVHDFRGTPYWEIKKIWDGRNKNPATSRPQL